MKSMISFFPASVLQALRHRTVAALILGLLVIIGFVAPPFAVGQEQPFWTNTAIDWSKPPQVFTHGSVSIENPSIVNGTIGNGGLAQNITVPESIDAEVASLAATVGAGQAVEGEDAAAKAVRIFNWVRNNTEYEHYYGLRKGAGLTLLEGAGNDFDQCALLGDLLKAAGYPATRVKFFLFSNIIDYTAPWGGIVLGGVLLVLAARALPRPAVGALTLGALLGAAQAQSPPAWENMAVPAPMTGAVVAGLEVKSSQGLQPRPANLQALALTVPQSIDAEIAALAAALGSGQAVDGESSAAKALRIFHWVRNHIDYEHYHGLRKGAVLALLEGSGNDFDQAALLQALLIAAGYDALNVKLVLVNQIVDYTQLMAWVGLAETPYPGQTFAQVHDFTIDQFFGVNSGVGELLAKQVFFGRDYLYTRGSTYNGGAPPYLSDSLPKNKASFVFERLMVYFVNDGIQYPLDPAAKSSEKLAATVDLATAAGYNRSNLLNATGGSGNADSTSGLSTTNLGTHLNSLTSNLLGQLGGALNQASMADLVNGRRIISQEFASLAAASALFSYLGDAVLFDSAANLGAYKATVRFRYGDIDYTLATSDLKGQKITLTFSGNTAELRLDDGAPVDTATVASSPFDLKVTVTHPGVLGTRDVNLTCRKNDAYAYALVYGFSASGRLIQKRHEQLRAYRDSGLAETTRQVRSEILNIIGLTWLYQTDLCERLLASRNDVSHHYAHRFGRVAQEEGYYIDVPLQLASDVLFDGLRNIGGTPRFDNVFHLGALFDSALEHGIIEQMQPGSSAISTVNILRKANETGNLLYLMTAANRAAVVAQLQNYTGPQINDFTAKVNAGGKVFLPRNARVAQGIWSGSGWVIRRGSEEAGMIINGNYSGGYSTARSSVISTPVWLQQAVNPTRIYTDSSVPVRTYVPPPPSAPRSFASDPVDMATGAFIYASDDLATGLEGAPRGLTFSRHYASNAATADDQNIGFGWTHNLHIRAATRTASEESFGLGSPQFAASFLVAVVAASDLYRADATPREWAAAALTVGWFVDQLKENAVAVTIGKDVFQFLRQPNGSYTPPAGSTLSLSPTGPGGSYFLRERLGNEIFFDSNRRAASITDVDGLAMKFYYHANGTLNYVEDHAARRFTFGYNGTRIATVTDSTGPARQVSFGYDVDWNLITATDPERKITRFDYAVAGDPGNTLATEHRMVRLRNHDDEVVTQNVYGSLGRVERQFLHGDTNKTFRLYYTGAVNYEVNPAGGITAYFYDERGRAAGQRDANGNTTRLGYDAYDRVMASTSATGEITGYAYDGKSNLTRIDHPRSGGSTIMDYDSLNRLDLLTDPHNVQTDYVYFTSGQHAGKDRPQSVIAAKGRVDESTTTYSYISSGRAVGRVATVKDGDGLTTDTTYDANGHPDVTTAPGGFTTNENYSARGNLDAVIDANGRTTAFAYNLRRQVTATVYDQGGADTGTEDRAFDNQARLQTSTAPAHNGGQRVAQTFTYNPTDKVRLEMLAGVTVADHTYDGRDWEANVKDAALRQTTFVRKASGALEQTQLPGGRNTTFGYDGDHRLTSSIKPGADSGNRTNGYAYDTDASGYPRTIFTDGDGLARISTFDRLGRLRFLQDKRLHTFEFRYDALGRKTQVIAPGRPAVVTNHTHDGRVVSETEPSGDSATFTYHPTTGRLQGITYQQAGGGASTVNYTSYDKNGNLLALDENGAGNIGRTYDNLGRVKSCTGPDGTIGYRYYPNGKLAKLIYPGGDETSGHVEYTYEASGRLYQVLDRLGGAVRTSTYTWRTDGRLESVTRPNNTVRRIGYDAAGRPVFISERTGGGTPVLSYAIGYYPSDELSSLKATPSAALSALAPATMTYDDADRLLTFHGTSVAQDADGNMTYGPLPLTGAAGTYTYDSRNRLTGAGGLTYSYDAQGNRIGIGGSETTSLLVDPAGALPKALVRVKNGVTTRYVYGAGLLYEVSASNAATYYHYDQSGNTAALTNQSGGVVERVEYSPYGTIRYRQSNFDTPFLFGGFFGVMTDSNGLIAMRARYYHPLTMRFLTSDPARDGWNWYAYAGGNPLSFADPSGFGASSVLDAIQTGLSFLGFVPGFGAFFDIANAAISAVRGNYGESAFSLAAAVPGIGDFAAAGKIAVTGAVAYKAAKAINTARTAATVERAAARGVANPVPGELARVIPGRGPFPTLGPPGRADVFVTAADDIAGLTPAQISQRLTIPASDTFSIIRFPTPSTGIASPVFRTDPGFIGGGRTLGGAREFVLPNGSIPSGATTTILGP